MEKANSTAHFQLCTWLSGPHGASLDSNPSLCLLLKRFPLTTALKEPRWHLYIENETVVHTLLPASEQSRTPSHSCNPMDMRRGKSWVFPVLHLLVLSAAPDPRLGAERLCQSRWMWGEEQGWRCRAPQPYHYAPDHKEERSLSLCGETQEYGHLPLKNHNIKEQLKKKPK